nr:arginine--tRNA ligase [Oscillospiraceae bacterium]
MNYIDTAKTQIDGILQAACAAAAEKGFLPSGGPLSGSVEIPRDLSHGDYAANHAMAAAKIMHMSPATIAKALVDCMDLTGTYVGGVEIAGPGFINFTLNQDWYSDVIRTVQREGKDFGRSDIGGGEKVMVEFVSANPTGPMTIGNARGGVLGDALASVLDRAGYSVWREFYVNNAGNQVDLFGRSIEARYLQLCLGVDAVEFPDNGYHGDDIRELAAEIRDLHGDAYVSADTEERRKAFIEYALPRNIERMKRDLARYRIHFDQWFLESDLHDSGYVAETVDL